MDSEPGFLLPPLQSAAGISFRESGTRAAPALVLLHGIGSTSSAWRLQYGPLGEHFRVVGWDAPGYGESPPLPDSAPAVEAYAQALARLLDAIGIGNAILGSNSWGTPTAVCFARVHPQRVRGLVLGGPTAGMGQASDLPGDGCLGRQGHRHSARCEREAHRRRGAGILTLTPFRGQACQTA